MTDFDVILFDACGMPFIGSTPEHQGLGGSEWEEVLLAEALAGAGYRVAVMSRSPTRARVRGVEYLPHDLLGLDTFTCQTLIVERNSVIPRDIKANRTIRWLQDVMIDFTCDVDELVCVSDWQRSSIKGTARTIPNMLPDWVYDLPPNRNTPAGSFIYASAVIKGLRPTLQYFDAMKKTKPFKLATLDVLSPGYDTPEKMALAGVKFVGSLPFKRVVEQMQRCRSMLYVSAFKETFCIVAALAEVLGLNLFILQSTGPDALTEVCNSPLITHDNAKFNELMKRYAERPNDFKPVEAKDYRVSSVLPRWLDVLSLTVPYPAHGG